MNIKQQFRQSLRCGTGEAYLILRANRNIDFSKDIEKAALKNYAYDPQCEGDRAFYISQFIDLSEKKEQLIKSVIKALKGEQKECWDLDQLFALTAIYAKQGNNQAKQAIYNRFGKKVIKDAKWLGEEEILQIGGLEGLKHIAKIRGKAMTKDPDDWEDSFFVDNFQEENPTLKVYDELKKAANTDPFAKKYLDMITKYKWSRPQKRKTPKFNYQFVKERIESPIRFPVPSHMAKKLTKTDLKKLADDFLKEKDIMKKGKYLSVFRNRNYPYDFREILKIAKGKNNYRSRLVEYACEALSYFKAKDIRQFAIEKLSKTNIPSNYLPLLVSNYKNGDHKLLMKIADRYKDEDVIHNLVWG